MAGNLAKIDEDGPRAVVVKVSLFDAFPPWTRNGLDGYALVQNNEKQ